MVAPAAQFQGATSERRTLAAGERVQLLWPSASKATYRLVEVGSFTGKPFRVRLEWVHDHGSPVFAYFDSGSVAQVCVYAASIKVEVTNLAPVANDVAAFVGSSEAAVATRNTRMETLADGGSISVPAYAYEVLVATRTAGIPVTATLLDAAGGTLAVVTGEAVTLPVGAADSLQVSGAPSTTFWRMVI